MNKYLHLLEWAVFSMIDRKTQDDKKSKIRVEALFSNPVQAECHYIPPNNSIKRYILNVEYLERFEKFYNFVQDINEKYSEKAIFHINDGEFTVDELNRFRTVLDIWTDTKIK